MSRCLRFVASVIALAAMLDPAWGQSSFKRGDANADGIVDFVDPMKTLGVLFIAKDQLPCDDAADSNDDGTIDVTDAVTTLRLLFVGRPEIPLPGLQECGRDPTPDALRCAVYMPCADPVSLKVAPVDPRIARGSTRQFEAEGMLANGTTVDMTARVRWSSSRPEFAIVGNTPGAEGLVTVSRPGATAISATDPNTGLVDSSSIIDEAGYFLSVSNVDLNRGETAAEVRPGASVSVSLSYRAWSRSGCPNCVDYIVAGIGADGQDAVRIGIPGRFPGRGGGASFTLRASSSPGDYTVFVVLAAVLSTSAAIGVYESDFPGPSFGPGFIPIGTVRVVETR